MGYLDFEHSVAAAKPVSLYEFIRGDNERIYRYTDADMDLTINGNTYQAIAISDSGRATNDNVTITLPSNNTVAQLFRGIAPSGRVTIKIYRLHIGDNNNEMRVVWLGVITEAKRPDIHYAELISTGMQSLTNSAGVRLCWGRNCPYALYDEYTCKVKSKDYALAGLTIEALDGVSITLSLPASVASGYFNAGYIAWSDADGVTETRAVKEHAGNKLTLMGGTQKLTVGQVITAYPGCDGTVTTCLKKFNNVLNFGGIPHMPYTNPYAGSRVF